MNQPVSRKQFLCANFTGRRRVIRPPWSQTEHAFCGECTRCDACIEACPEQILSRDNNGFPYVDFSRGECSFCGECVRVCKDGALSQQGDDKPWDLRAIINTSCLPLQGVVCGSCKDECEHTAINMKLVAGGISIPQLDMDSCTGCGACYRVCPTQAIEFSYGANT